MVVGWCYDSQPRNQPGDVIRVLPVARPRFFAAPKLPLDLQLAAEPIAAFHCVEIAVQEGPERRRVTAVEVQPTGPSPRFLPGWIAYPAWDSVRRSREWQDARRRAELPP